jgi:hypothetical protein
LLKSRVERWKNKSGGPSVTKGKYKKGAKTSTGHKVEVASSVDKKIDLSLNSDGETNHEEKVDNRLSTPKV